MHDVRAFSEIIRIDDPPLDMAMALIAATGRPEVDPGALLTRLDQIADEVGSDDAAGLCAELFGSGRFRGDTTDYYDPRNSLLDEVLERGVGIPITLSALAIEVGRRRSIELSGVGMPGHFLLTVPGPTWDRDAVFFDAFQGGLQLGRADCARIFEQLHGDQLAFDDSYLEPTPSDMMIVRILNNLRGAYVRRGDRAGLTRIVSLQTALPGSGTAQLLELAKLFAADGNYLDAAAIYEVLAIDDPDHRMDHERSALRLRAQLN